MRGGVTLDRRRMRLAAEKAAEEVCRRRDRKPEEIRRRWHPEADGKEAEHDPGGDKGLAQDP